MASGMLLATSGVTVRLVFRALFTVLFFYLSIVGTYCNEFARKRQLLRKRRIRVIETAGWLDPMGLLDGLRNIRRIPNFTWWSIMLVIGLLSLGTDFATTFVQQKYIQGSCDFGTGMVLSLTSRDLFNPPPPNGRPVFVAGSAQKTSLANGCSEAIYRKVNSDPNFCAAPRDILGTWKCHGVGNDITYMYGEYTNYTLLHDLTERGLLYPGSEVSGSDLNNDTHRFSHLVAWGTSTYDGSDELWDIKASIDMTRHDTDDKVMHSMRCAMHAPGADEIMRNMSSQTVLLVWGSLLQGYMYDGYSSPPVDDPEGTLAWFLNTLIMVAGGSDNLLQKPANGDSQQGCVIRRTLIPWWLIALLFVTIFACICMTAGAVLFWSQVRKHASGEDVKYTPTDLWTWMAQAVTESSRGAGSIAFAVEREELHSWDIVVGDDLGVRIEKRSAEADDVDGLVVLTKNETGDRDK